MQMCGIQKFLSCIKDFIKNFSGKLILSSVIKILYIPSLYICFSRTFHVKDLFEFLLKEIYVKEIIDQFFDTSESIPPCMAKFSEEYTESFSLSCPQAFKSVRIIIICKLPKLLIPIKFFLVAILEKSSLVFQSKEKIQK